MLTERLLFSYLSTDEMVTETVRNVVRNQFGCQEWSGGGRLENQPTGDTDCFGSHWDHVSQ